MNKVTDCSSSPLYDWLDFSFDMKIEECSSVY